MIGYRVLRAGDRSLVLMVYGHEEAAKERCWRAAFADGTAVKVQRRTRKGHWRTVGWTDERGEE